MKAIFQNKIVQMSIFLSIAVGLIYWQYVTLDPTQLTEIKDSFSHTQWHFLVFALVIGFFSHYFRALRWQLMLDHMGHSTTKGVITGSVLMGYLTNLLIPRLGEVMKCTTLYKYNKVPVDKSLGTVVSERIFDVICLGLLFFLVFIIEYQNVSTYTTELIIDFQEKFNVNIQWWWSFIAVFSLVVALVIGRKLYTKIQKSKLGKFIQSFLLGLQSIFTLRKRALFIFYSIMIWLLYVVMVYIAMKAVPATAHLPFSVSMVLTAFGSIAIILTPGGIGAYPPIIAGLLTIYNIPYSYGLSAGWVSWIMQTLVVIILGIMTLFYLPLSQKNNSSVTP